MCVYIYITEVVWVRGKLYGALQISPSSVTSYLPPLRAVGWLTARSPLAPSTLYARTYVSFKTTLHSIL